MVTPCRFAAALVVGRQGVCGSASGGDGPQREHRHSPEQRQSQNEDDENNAPARRPGRERIQGAIESEHRYGTTHKYHRQSREQLSIARREHPYGADGEQDEDGRDEYNVHERHRFEKVVWVLQLQADDDTNQSARTPPSLRAECRSGSAPLAATEGGCLGPTRTAHERESFRTQPSPRRDRR